MVQTLQTINSVFTNIDSFYLRLPLNFDENMILKTFYSYLHKSTTRKHSLS